MIFQYTLDLLLSGRKTQTRRVIKAGESTIQADDRIVAVQTHGRDKYRVGKTYAVQPSRNAAAVARIRLTGLRRQRAGEISLEDAQAEGYASREEFFATVAANSRRGQARRDRVGAELRVDPSPQIDVSSL